MLISTYRKLGITVNSKIDILLILTNHYFQAQNLSVKNGENNGILVCYTAVFSSSRNAPPH